MRDSDSIRRRYSDDVLLDFINEAQREIVNQTWLSRKTTEYVLSPQTTFYSLPDDFIAADQVYFTNGNGDLLDLDEVRQKSLYDRNPGWMSDSSGEPIEYWISDSTYSSTTSSQTQRISYLPIPTNTSTGTVTIWYYNRCSDLSSDTDVPFDGKIELFPYHMSIIYHAAMRLKLIENRLDEASIYMNLYGSYVNTIKTKAGQNPNYSPGMIFGNPNR